MRLRLLADLGEYLSVNSLFIKTEASVLKKILLEKQFQSILNKTARRGVTNSLVTQQVSGYNTWNIIPEMWETQA